MSNVLVTGGAGFIGPHVAEELVTRLTQSIERDGVPEERRKPIG